MGIVAIWICRDVTINPSCRWYYVSHNFNMRVMIHWGIYCSVHINLFDSYVVTLFL